jgi:hypothetical protein
MYFKLEIVVVQPGFDCDQGIKFPDTSSKLAIHTAKSG